jgi:hypothetical protein
MSMVDDFRSSPVALSFQFDQTTAMVMKAENLDLSHVEQFKKGRGPISG